MFDALSHPCKDKGMNIFINVIKDTNAFRRFSRKLMANVQPILLKNRKRNHFKFQLVVSIKTFKKYKDLTNREL
jgi:hypothetical protein